VERIEPVIGYNEDVAIRHSICIGTDGVDDVLHRFVRHVIGSHNVVAVARQFHGILILADRVRVDGIGRLPGIDREELMFGAIRLLDVNHGQIDIRESRDGAPGDVRLIGHKLPHQLFVNRFELGIRETSESGWDGINPLDDSEVGLWLPKANVVVDVVDIG